ncbi:MAG: rRNA maturation RNase YbeY [Armatimonadota bacterium]
MEAVRSLLRDPASLPESRSGETIDGPGVEISAVLVGDEAIRVLNLRWRGKDKPTDVLSWPISGEDEPLGPLLGDIVVSVDTAGRQAAARGWTVEEELALLFVHGALHLLGHEDDTEAGAESMRRIERRILGKPLDAVECPA